MINEINQKFEILRNSSLFKCIDNDILKNLSQQCRLESYQSNSTIFSKGQKATDFFIVEQGEINLSAPNWKKEKQILLNDNDFFGEEVLFNNIEYGKTAITNKPSSVLVIPITEMLKYLISCRDLKTKVRILAESRQLSLNMEMPWLNEEEEIQILTRKHPVLLLGGVLLPIIFYLVLFFAITTITPRFNIQVWITSLIYIVGFLIALVWLLWNMLNWANDYYVITNQRMVWVEKVAGFYDSRQEAPLGTLLAIGTRKTRLGNILGYADIVVRTYVGNISFSKVRFAKLIAEVIEDYWKKIKKNETEIDSEIMRSALRNKILGEEKKNDLSVNVFDETKFNQTKQVDREGNFFEWLFSDFLKVRHEVGDVTTYRKHWFLLIKGISLSVVFLLLFLILLFITLSNRIQILTKQPAIIISGLGIFASFLWLIYKYIDWRDDKFQLTSDQVIDIDRKPLGKETRRAAPLENILSIEYERKGIFAILFDFGTVKITVGNTKLTFNHVYNPSKIQQDIFSRMGKKFQEKQELTVEQQRERVSDWFKVYHEEVNKTKLPD